jgi:organic radical activating enzyme
MLEDKNFCYLSEVFCSLQGEGVNIGIPQIFIRFAGCNLKCTYCDTAYSWDIFKSKCNLFGTFLKNPIHIDKLIETVEKKIKIGYKWISLTGGEPLLQYSFVKNFVKKIKKRHQLHIQLETNGTHLEKICDVLSLIDHITVTLKRNATDIETLKKIISRFSGKISLKIMIERNTQEEEIRQALRFIKKTNHKIPLIFQPLSAKGKVSKYNITKSIKLYLSFRKKLEPHITSLRVIPQMHKVWLMK